MYAASLGRIVTDTYVSDTGVIMKLTELNSQKLCNTYVFILFQVYQVAYVIVKAANSPRPGNWILERSIDGVTYKPWQYYAISDSECWNTYGIDPTVGIPKFERDDDVLCMSQYSRLDPLRNGEVMNVKNYYSSTFFPNAEPTSCFCKKKKILSFFVFIFNI